MVEITHEETITLRRSNSLGNRHCNNDDWDQKQNHKLKQRQKTGTASKDQETAMPRHKMSRRPVCLVKKSPQYILIAATLQYVVFSFCSIHYPYNCETIDTHSNYANEILQEEKRQTSTSLLRGNIHTGFTLDEESKRVNEIPTNDIVPQGKVSINKVGEKDSPAGNFIEEFGHIPKNKKPENIQGATSKSEEKDYDDVGTLLNNRDVSKSEIALPATSQTPNMKKPMKVLLYITTHMSAQHIWYLKTCWPRALRNSKLLNTTDVKVYLTPPEDKRNEAKSIFNKTFQNQSIQFIDHPALGHQAGAMEALTAATRGGFFDGYDWVIRVNPDVIVRNDTYILNVMLHDPEATALLIKCKTKFDTLMQTDFFAIKPSALPPDAFLNPNLNDMAEKSFTKAIQGTILDKGNHRWVPGADPNSDITCCRAGVGKKLEDSHVTHVHPIRNVLKGEECPIPF